MIDDVFTTVRENSEKVMLLVYLGVIGALAGPLAESMGKAWEQDGLSRALIHTHVYFGVQLDELTALLIGLFLGFLVMMTLDPKKRWQGILLWFGFAIGLLALRSLGLIFPHVDFVETLPWWGGGLIAGVVIVGNKQLTRVQTAEPFEFRRAPTAVFYLLAVLVIVALAELHIQYPEYIIRTGDGIAIAENPDGSFGIETSGAAVNLLVAGGFLYVTKRFVEYDAEKDFFVLGPPASGKSLFLIGAYLEALDRNDDNMSTPLNPSNDLAAMVDKLDQDNSDWIVEATASGEIKELEFKYIDGQVFPKYISVSGLDYAGEYLSRIPDALSGLLENEEDTILLMLAKKIRKADTLVLVIDTERFVSDQSLDISEYFPIVQATEDTDVMLVATKADLLAEEFTDERGLEPHRYYEEFQEYVNAELTQSENISALVQETAGSEIYPVYYETTVNEVDARVPMRDERGSVITVGFDKILERLAR